VLENKQISRVKILMGTSGEAGYSALADPVLEPFPVLLRIGQFQHSSPISSNQKENSDKTPIIFPGRKSLSTLVLPELIIPGFMLLAGDFPVSGGGVERSVP
jgi:hypothetical protein